MKKNKIAFWFLLSVASAVIFSAIASRFIDSNILAIADKSSVHLTGQVCLLVAILIGRKNRRDEKKGDFQENEGIKPRTLQIYKAGSANIPPPPGDV